MIRVSNNYRQANADLNCPLCSPGCVNGLKHLNDLLHCVKLVDTTSNTDAESFCNYEDIFSNDVQKMAVVAEVLKKVIHKREDLLSKT